MFPKT
jgi:hypothetical protein